MNVREQLFGQKPRVFRNTELIYNNELGDYVRQMGYDGVICEGADHILGFRSPNYVYNTPSNNGISVSAPRIHQKKP